MIASWRPNLLTFMYPSGKLCNCCGSNTLVFIELCDLIGQEFFYESITCFKTWSHHYLGLINQADAFQRTSTAYKALTKNRTRDDNR